MTAASQHDDAAALREYQIAKRGTSVVEPWPLHGSSEVRAFLRRHPAIGAAGTTPTPDRSVDELDAERDRQKAFGRVVMFFIGVAYGLCLGALLSVAIWRAVG